MSTNLLTIYNKLGLGRIWYFLPDAGCFSKKMPDAGYPVPAGCQDNIYQPGVTRLIETSKLHSLFSLNKKYLPNKPRQAGQTSLECLRLNLNSEHSILLCEKKIMISYYLKLHYHCINPSSNAFLLLSFRNKQVSLKKSNILNIELVTLLFTFLLQNVIS